jgi:sulfotransferase
MPLHFLSGLPRSGTSLLASILTQNPTTYSSIMSPLGQIVVELHHAISANEAAIYLSDSQRRKLFVGLFREYYADIKADFNTDTIIDNNRRWCAKWPLISHLFPDAKLICCVRPLAWIADSVERLTKEHPLQLSALYNYQANSTVYTRMDLLMRPEGLIGYAYNALRDAYFGPHNDRILLVEYDQLTKNPKKTLQDIEAFLGLSPFTYNFDSINQLPGAKEFDERLGTPGLHFLGNKVTHVLRSPILPPDIFASFAEPFWH